MNFNATFFCIICQLWVIQLLPVPKNARFRSKMTQKWLKNNHKCLRYAPNLKFYIFILVRYTKYIFVWSLFPNALQLFKKLHFFCNTKIFYFWNFPHFDEVGMDLKNTLLNKSGYFRTLASMIESTALDFWRKSEKPEIESYTINHDFRKIQVKNTASCWILPYIYNKFFFPNSLNEIIDCKKKDNFLLYWCQAI